MMPSNYITMTTLITITIMMAMMIMKQKFTSNFNNKLNIECGFNSLTEKTFKFSNQFFMIAILFVIFDMELIAIMPIPITKMEKNMISMLISILIMLTFSLLMEWMNGLVEWKK